MSLWLRCSKCLISLEDLGGYVIRPRLRSISSSILLFFLLFHVLYLLMAQVDEGVECLKFVGTMGTA